MNKIMSIAKKYSIPVIEDACMGIGAMVNNKAPGTFGTVNAFSMHPLKSLNVMGDGGMITTNDDEIAKWISKYRNHGMVDRDNIDFWGVNMRIQPLQAIVGCHGLEKLEDTINKRNKNASVLDKGLKQLDQFVHVPERINGNKETFALYMALFERRDELKKYLIDNDIEVKIHYPIPLHKQKAAQKGCVFVKEKLKNVDYQADRLLTIPVHQFLKEEHMHWVLTKIFKFYGKKYEN